MRTRRSAVIWGSRAIAEFRARRAAGQQARRNALLLEAIAALASLLGRLWAIIDEAVIHRVVGGTEVMRGQLRHLVESAQQGKTTIQIRGRTGPLHASREATPGMTSQVAAARC
jgi:Domain of unknown function (DUF5753)